MRKINAITLNIIANTLSFGISLIISFLLTPYITKTVGIEAYGLIGLANSFIGYINVLTAALNSMASRFIVLELHKDNTHKANVYFSSVLLSNTIFAIFITLPAIWLISNIHVLNLSDNLIHDAKITFSLIFINFVISLLSALFGVVLYAKNILWKGSLRTAESNLIRVALILIFFSCVSYRIYNVVLATLISSLYVIGFNIYYTHKYIPSFRISTKNFSFSAVGELISAGIWNSITKLSQILLDGLDLLLSNLFISGVMTGNVSIAKTVPSLYVSVVAIISDSFYPEFLDLYSKNEQKKLLQSINNSITVLSSISGICLSILFVYAKEFYTLWVPDCDSLILSRITYLSAGTVLISGCVYSLFYVFSLTNKVRNNSIVLFITGFLSAITTFFALKFTSLGVYAIVGVSSVFGIIRNLTFTPLYAAKCLSLKWSTFYPVIIKNLLIISVLMLLFSLVKTFLYPTTWILLICNGLINLVAGSVLVFLVSLNQDQKLRILKRIKKKFS